MKQLLLSGLVACALVCGAAAAAQTPREPVVGGPCEGCEAVFEGMPKSPAWSARIAPAGQAGAPMRIEGVVRGTDGLPMAGVIVYAYHTDDRGIYPRDDRYEGSAARHGRLRGWARTDRLGRYRFDTIRPAGYPGTNIPQHVHMHIVEPGRCTYYIDDIHFEDDERFTGALRDELPGRGGPGVVMPFLDADGVWHVVRDIALGENIPGYPERSGAR